MLPTASVRDKPARLIAVCNEDGGEEKQQAEAMATSTNGRLVHCLQPWAHSEAPNTCPSTAQGSSCGLPGVPVLAILALTGYDAARYKVRDACGIGHAFTPSPRAAPY